MNTNFTELITNRLQRLVAGESEELRLLNGQFEFWKTQGTTGSLVRTIDSRDVIWVRAIGEMSLRPWYPLLLIFMSIQSLFGQADTQQPRPQLTRVEAVASMDTVFVTTSSTLLMVFPDPVKKLDLGTKEFGGSPDGNTVMLKAIKSSAIPTSLIVLYGEGEFYHGTIAFDDARFRKMPIIRMTKPAVANTDIINDKRAITDKSETIDKQTLYRRLGHIEAADDRFSDIAQMTDKLALGLKDLMSDERMYYIKLVLVNKSKQDYLVQSVFFTYKTPRPNSKETDITPMNPEGSNEVKAVKVKEEKYLVFAVPRYTLSTEGVLQIEVHEENGSRIVPLEVKFSVLQKAKSFL